MTGNVEWKLLMATSDEAEVTLLKGRLEGEGVSCRVDVQNRYPDQPNAGRSREFRVYVPVGEFEASLLVLEDDEMDEEL